MEITLTEKEQRLVKLYKEAMEGYHTLANIITKNAHTCESWELCLEPSCRSGKEALRSIIEGE